MKRPNWANKSDACCCCGKVTACPADHTKAGVTELRVWQPNPTDPPQWICAECESRLQADERRAS